MVKLLFLGFGSWARQTFSGIIRHRLLFPLLLLFIPFVLGFGPFRQVPIPDPDSYLIYGVPWMVVGMVLVGLLEKYLWVSSEAGVLAKAVWAAIGYLLLQTLPDIQAVAPWLPKYLPMVLATILIFGSEMGLVPGTTARKLTRGLRR